MVLTDSCCALSMNEQVFTTMTSASSACGTSSAPPWASMPIMASLSTRYLGQPRLTNPTFGRAEIGCSGAITGKDFGDMRSFYFSSPTYHLTARLLLICVIPNDGAVYPPAEGPRVYYGRA